MYTHNKPDTHEADLDIEIMTNEESPEEIKAGLAFLLNRFTESHDKRIASKIVTQLEKLLICVKDFGDAQERCIFYKLLRYWRTMSI